MSGDFHQVHTTMCLAGIAIYGGVSCSRLLDLVQMDLESVHFSECVHVMYVHV